jgi:hypothetical protein
LTAKKERFMAPSSPSQRPDPAGKEPLVEELDRLETAFATPPMPGELRNWASMLRKSFDEATGELTRRIADEHPVQFDEISTQDPEMLHQVDELRQQDARLEQQRAELASQVAGFEAQAVAKGADEKPLEEWQQQLSREGLAFVVEARKQEIALRTYLQEAFSRDRGVMD